MSIRVLLINYEYPPFGGGAANATQSLAAALDNQGHQVTVLTGSVDQPLKGGDGVDLISVKSRRTHYGKSNIWEMASFLLKGSIWALQCRRGRWDIAIAFFGIPCGPIATLLKWRTQLPYVVSLRGGDVPGFEPEVEGFHRWLKPIRRLVYRNAISVVANSKSLATLSERSDPFAVKVIPNGVNTNIFCPGSRRREPGESLKVLMASRFHAQKKIPDTLKMLREAQEEGIDIHLLLVGEGPEQGAILDAIKNLGMNEMVSLTGWLTKEKVLAAYQSADCFVSLSAYEGMPNSVLEAMACQLPVVLSNIKAHRELVRDQENGFLIENGNPRAFISVLKRIGKRDDEVKKLEKRARQTVEQQFSWPAAAASYISLFEKEPRL